MLILSIALLDFSTNLYKLKYVIKKQKNPSDEPTFYMHREQHHKKIYYYIYSLWYNVLFWKKKTLKTLLFVNKK